MSCALVPLSALDSSRFLRYLKNLGKFNRDKINKKAQRKLKSFYYSIFGNLKSQTHVHNLFNYTPSEDENFY